MPLVVEVSEVTTGWSYDPESQFGPHRIGPVRTRFELTCREGEAQLVRLHLKDGSWVQSGDPLKTTVAALATAGPEAFPRSGWMFPPRDSGVWTPQHQGPYRCAVTPRAMPGFPAARRVAGSCTVNGDPDARHLEALLIADGEYGGIHTGELVLVGARVRDIPYEDRTSSDQVAIGPNWSWQKTVVQVFFPPRDAARP